ncbi:Hsp70 family protein [Gandjariella thermophila]|uniref:Chaperone protein DnaK n=1 Tax=Gandjariella thermophila TaxID=1931992 RepID=A0A4D4J5L3_9PSEU|nr:Hsp70 family protein [Gandjariella thermophila]GDY31985.1 chaperone protein DnaK [Gandjariella thermophila]
MTAIGIDLGTTNSVVARYDPEQDRASVVTIGGARSTPSVVSLRQRGGKEDLLVGGPALNWAKAAPANTILSVKRLMGRDFADPAVAETRARRSYQIVSGPNDDPRAHVVIGERTYTPAQVSTMILERLKNGAAEKLKEDVTHAVITVPAYFKEAQRAATREAGEQAGLVVKRIIDEPTAAAIAFGLELREGERRRVLVYDLGGGTFDISILNTAKDADGHNHFQVLDFVGDNWLGGDDFDLLIVEKIIEWVRRNAAVDPSGDDEFLFIAKKAAEEAKRTLSEADWADIIIPAAFRAAGSPVDVEMTLTRDDFEALIEPLVDRTIHLVRTALERQNLSPDDISDVLLVGGSTQIPKVREAVENFFGTGKVRRHIDPMECVAVGAGILASTLHGVECLSCATVNDETASECRKCRQSLVNARSAGDTHVYDVTGMALGVAAVRGSQADTFVPIIPRGTPYPMSEPMRHTFQTTDGRVIRVPVYEGDSATASENQEQGVIEYELPEEIDIHTRVEVSFLFDRNRELHVTIAVPGTNMEYRKKLRFDTARAEAPAKADFEEDDATYREDLVYLEEVTRRFLRTYEQYLRPSQAMKIQGDLERAQQTLVFSDPAECRRMISVLQSDLFGSGLASQLYIAERAADRATATDAQQINQAVAALQQSFQQGKQEAVAEQAQVLKLMVAKVGQQYEVAEVGDAEDFAGLLKLLDDA